MMQSRTELARAGARSQTLHARIIRKDGTVEELGILARVHANPFIHAWWQVTDGARRLCKHIHRGFTNAQ